jgi:RNA polymerase subunit RPABC4/transcription elongation factor Spt4
MIQCQNCGQANAPESQFCRFCGTKFLVRQPMPQQGYDYQAPRPYAWKTDEFQTQAEPRRNAPGDWNPTGPAPMATADSQYMSGNYRCPNCMSQMLPQIERSISTAGWIVFAVLLVVFFPLFWVGLLIKEDVHVCPACKTRLR